MKNICILIFIIYCLLISCNKKRPVEIDNQEVISESNFEEFIKAGDSLALNELGTQKNLLDFEKDIYPYYLRIFTIPGITEVFAAIATFEPEQVKFYKKLNNRWVNIMIFEIDLVRAFEIFSRLEDFNFDGYQDIALHYSTSNGCASEYFQLFTYDPGSNNFKYIKEFSELGCPVVLPNEKIIKSRHASCGCDCFMISEHKWTGDSMILYKTIVKDNHHDTLIASFYNYAGILVKEEKKIISFQEAEKLLNYYPIRKKMIKNN